MNMIRLCYLLNKKIATKNNKNIKIALFLLKLFCFGVSNYRMDGYPLPGMGLAGYPAKLVSGAWLRQM